MNNDIDNNILYDNEGNVIGYGNSFSTDDDGFLYFNNQLVHSSGFGAAEVIRPPVCGYLPGYGWRGGLREFVHSTKEREGDC